jgi:predicted nucleotidyltransferase
MKEQVDLLKKIVKEFKNSQIEYMISGSFGSTLYGEVRATNDIDIVIDCTIGQLENFVESIESNYYVSNEAAKEAFRQRSMFNIIDYSTGVKIDLIIRKKRAYSIEEFSRRRSIQFEDEEFLFVSPEDSILSKLEWAKLGESERQFRDAVGVALVQWEHLDIEYLHKWAKNLDMEELLEDLIQSVKKLFENDKF